MGYEGNIWAILGPFMFKLRKHPEKVTSSQKDTWAEHAVIEGRPKLQWMGLDLREFVLDCRIHERFSDPGEFIDAIRGLMGQGKHYTFIVIGEGLYGEYVVTDVSEEWHMTDRMGDICDAGIKINLREWVDDGD